MSDPSDDALLRRVLWALPTGLYVLGSTQELTRGPWNMMTINLVTQVATEPRIVAFAVEVGSRTEGFLEATGVASLNVLDREQRALVRKFVKPVEDVELGADGRPVRMAGVPVAILDNGAPALDDAVAVLELDVVRRIGFDSHVTYFGRVGAARARPELLEGSASARTVELLRMEDTKMNYGG